MWTSQLFSAERKVGLPGEEKFDGVSRLARIRVAENDFATFANEDPERSGHNHSLRRTGNPKSDIARDLLADCAALGRTGRATAGPKQLGRDPGPPRADFRYCSRLNHSAVSQQRPRRLLRWADLEAPILTPTYQQPCEPECESP